MVSVVEEILDLARWAPSGDNTQPWRFQIVSDQHVVIHGFDTRDSCVYDLDGRSSQISIGAFLETLRIAATGHGFTAHVHRRPDSPEPNPVFDVTLAPDPSIKASDLIPVIRIRSVQRRPLSTRPIRPEEKAALAGALPPEYTLLWLEGRARRWAVARLLFASAKIRLTTREAYEVHKRVIEWNAQFSEDRIPDRAIGLDPFLTRFMAWAMQDWRRVWFLNTFLAGTLMPRLQLDFLPSIACAAHLVIVAREEPRGIDDYIAAGRAIQRFWLTATQLGLQHQPELTPLIFARYEREGIRFTSYKRSIKMAQEVSRRLERLLGAATLPRSIWIGRIGAGPAPVARSLRMPIQGLMVRE